MKYTDLIKTASSSMLRSKLRTLLTIIAIFIGAMTITLTNGIGTGIKSYINKQIGNLGATNILMVQVQQKSSRLNTNNSGPALYNPNQKVSITSFGGPGERQVLMTQTDINTIKTIPNVTSVSPRRNISPDYIAGTGKKYQVTVDQQFGTTTAQMQTGSGVNINSSSNQISLPNNYASSLGYNNNSIVGKTVSLGITNAYGQQSTVNATVTGIQEKNLVGSTVAYINAALANQLFSVQSQGLPPATVNSFATVEVEFPASLTDAQIQTLKNQLNNKGYTGQTVKDTENTIFSAINAIILVFDMFGIIALLAASFGIINTLLMSVQERTKDIGLMKALGMSPRKIFLLFSFEAVLIGFWGSIIGVFVATLIGKLINAVAKNGFLKYFPGLTLLTFPLKTILIVVIGIMVIAFLAGTLPAIKASRKDPIEALRYE